jgi:hypothetical protein
VSSDLRIGEMRAEAVPRKADNLAEVSSEGRTSLVALDRPADPPVILEGAAHTLWRFVDGQRSVAQMCAGLDLSLDNQAVTAFFEDLADRGFLRLEEAR